MLPGLNAGLNAPAYRHTVAYLGIFRGVFILGLYTLAPVHGQIDFLRSEKGLGTFGMTWGVRGQVAGPRGLRTARELSAACKEIPNYLRSSYIIRTLCI